MTNQNNNEITKRSFLQSVGMIGGTAALITALNGFNKGFASSMTQPPNMVSSGNGKKIIILGAGLAGMVLGLELRKKGYNCEIIEARSFAGGRCQSARKGSIVHEIGGERQVCNFENGQYLNHGPWRIAAEHHSTIHYCHSLGVELQPMINECAQSYLYSENIDGPLKGKRIRNIEAKIDRHGNINELLAKCASDGSLDDKMTAEDRDMLLEHLKATGLIDTKELNYSAGRARGYADYPGAGMNFGVLSEVYNYSDLLKVSLGTRYDTTDHPAVMFQPVGGMDQIAKAMEKALPKNIIRFNSEITEIAQSENNVIVTYEDTKTGKISSITGDYCISCLPFPLLNKIKTDFRQDVIDGLTAPASSPIVKQGHQFSTRFWEEKEMIFGGVTKNDIPESGTISYPSSEFFGNKGGVLLTAYARQGGAIKLGNMSIIERVEKGLEIGEKIHPGRFRKNFNGKAISMAWHKQKYSLAAWVTWSRRNIDLKMPALVKGEKRVIFSGNGMAPLHQGWMFAAIESAWHAIGDLDKRVSKE